MLRSNFLSNKSIGLVVPLLIVLHCSVPDLLCQKTLVDSLNQLILIEKIDSVKLDYLDQIITNGGLKDVAEIKTYFEKGKRISGKIGDVKKGLNFQRNTAYTLIGIGAFEAAEDIYQDLLNECIETNELECKVDAELDKCSILCKKGKGDECINCMQKAVNDSHVIGYKYGCGYGHYKMAARLRSQGDLEKAIFHLDSAEIINKQEPNAFLTININLIRGRIYRAKGDYALAKEQYLATEKLAMDLDYLDDLKVIYNNLGTIEQTQGNYESSIEYYVKSIRIKEKLNDTRGLAVGYFNIGTIQNDMEDYVGSLVNFDKSMKIAKEIKDYRLIILNLLRYGDVAKEQKEFDKAIAYEEEALALSLEHQYKKGHVTSLYHLGIIYQWMENYKKSYEYFFILLPLVQEMGSKPYESATLAAIAKNYVSERMEDNFMESTLVQHEMLNDDNILRLLARADDLANYMEAPENKMDVLQALGLFHKQKKNYKLSTEVLTRYMSLKDSLFTANRNKSVAEWETKFNVADKEREIVKLESETKIAELRNQRNKSILLGTILFFIGFITFGLTYLKQRNAKREAKKTEAFRSKLSSDLHDDVGSILTGLTMQTELLEMHVGESNRHHFEKIGEMSRSAMSRMRDTVWAIDSRKDKINDLVDRMLDFSNDALAPAGKRLIFENKINNIEQKIKPSVRQALYLIYKEALTNSIKHSPGKEVNTKLSMDGNIIKMEISDENQGLSRDIQTSGTGISNMQMRAEKLGGHFSYRIDDGFHITTSIPTNA